jgi:hypothetical protein
MSTEVEVDRMALEAGLRQIAELEKSELSTHNERCEKATRNNERAQRMADGTREALQIALAARHAFTWETSTRRSLLLGRLRQSAPHCLHQAISALRRKADKYRFEATAMTPVLAAKLERLKAAWEGLERLLETAIDEEAAGEEVATLFQQLNESGVRIVTSGGEIALPLRRRLESQVPA